MSDDPKTYWWGVVELNKQLQERIKELEAENSRLRSDRDNYNASRDHALNAIAEALAWPEMKTRTIENAVSNLLQRFDLFKTAHAADAERLRKAIGEARTLLARDDKSATVGEAFNVLCAALSPSPAAASGETTEQLVGRLDKPFHRPECQCESCLAWIRENPLPTSAPAAESKSSVVNCCVVCGTKWEYGKNLPCPKCCPK